MAEKPQRSNVTLKVRAPSPAKDARAYKTLADWSSLSSSPQKAVSSAVADLVFA